ncbi:hypothetical protein BDD12DRAFT_828396 [Trichophaea hybrida]|nr:hypothetical protein BDD12DRAFT_828396 [Trichophaea hybrida]
MLVSLGGDGEQTKARAVFIDEAGSAVDVAREGADMGQWLERVLTGKEVEEFVHPEQKRELLQRMMAGGRQRVSGEMEEDSLPGGETVDTEINIESLRKKVLLMKMQKARAMAAEAKKTLVVPRKPVVGVVGAMKAVSTSFGVKTAKKEFLKKPVVAVKTALLTKTVPPATPPTMAKTTSMPFGTKKEWQTNPSVVVKTAPPTTPTPATSISSGANKEWQNKPPATFKTYPPAKPHTAAKAAPTYYGKKRGWPKKPAVTVSTALPTTPTPTTSFSAIKEPPEKPAVTVNTTQPAAQNPWIKMDAKSKSPSTSFKSKSSFMGFKQKASTSRGRSG